MKIVFLDIDGVLNSKRFFKGRKWDDYIERFQIVKPTDVVAWARMLDDEATRLLHNFAVADKKVHFVISSSWREVHSIARMRRIFVEGGSDYIAEHIIDRTCISQIGSVGRAELIVSWVDRFSEEIDAWVAVDDMPLSGIEEAHHVRTTWADGLQKEHIEKLRELLK